MAEIIPQHIAIICDGNRRWARRHGWEVFKGHEHAVKKVFEPLITHAIERGVQYLTFWIFSTENWDRAKKEVDFLMDLFRHLFDEEIKRLDKKGVKFNMIGDKSRFAEDIQERIERGMEETKENTAITVTWAMNYGGRDEIVRATKKIVAAVQAGELAADAITEDVFAKYLDTAGLPDPEFIIRTSGELRMSGYLSWQNQYSEFWFPQFDFPEFTPERLDEAIAEFNTRQRRFGK